MRINTLCPECNGHGDIKVARAAVDLSSGQGSTGLVTEVCKNCGGDGRLKGFQPPV